MDQIKKLRFGHAPISQIGNFGEEGMPPKKNYWEGGQNHWKIARHLVLSPKNW